MVVKPLINKSLSYFFSIFSERKEKDQYAPEARGADVFHKKTGVCLSEKMGRSLLLGGGHIPAQCQTPATLLESDKFSQCLKIIRDVL